MQDIKFLKYQLTPSEKNLGVVSILYKGSIVLRYKVIQTKDGTSTFFAPASLKVQDEVTREDSFIESFMIDSRYENDEIHNFIRSNLKIWHQQHKAQNQNQDAFTETTSFNDSTCPF
jgi:hypothetical protein